MTVVTVFCYYVKYRHNRHNRHGMVITMKNVQISQELFVTLLHYHLSGENEYEEVIEQGLEQKLDAMLRHELYAQYKTAPTEEQREQARQEYLDRRGVPESFRW